MLYFAICASLPIYIGKIVIEKKIIGSKKGLEQKLIIHNMWTLVRYDIIGCNSHQHWPERPCRYTTQLLVFLIFSPSFNLATDLEIRNQLQAMNWKIYSTGWFIFLHQHKYICHVWYDIIMYTTVCHALNFCAYNNCYTVYNIKMCIISSNNCLNLHV